MFWLFVCLFVFLHFLFHTLVKVYPFIVPHKGIKETIIINDYCHLHNSPPHMKTIVKQTRTHTFAFYYFDNTRMSRNYLKVCWFEDM